MVDVSIIIVNYNVRHFILQCLGSIYQSNLANFTYKVYVVDNASIDGSVTAIKSKFPNVEIIANSVNNGFGKANNQAISIVKSKFCLLVNPDTILQENTLQVCISHMLDNGNCGAVGVKMVDGQGNYLPESKRSLPSPASSFFKITRLNELFPNSSFFNSYYTSDKSGNLDEQVEVLCGAFMFCRTSVLKELGGFDEAFFMYGEDIDLSKRILEAGYTISYTAKTRIIHFKGESSKKASFNYIHSFYNAMIIYVDKHFTSSRARITKVFLKLAIIASATLRFLKENLLNLLRPIIDFILIFILLELLKDFWSQFYFGISNYYNSDHFVVNKTFYALVWVLNLWFWGWYDGKRKIKSLFFGIGVGTLLILVAYALFPVDYRSSRTLIIIGSIVAFISPILNDILTNKIWLFRNKASGLTNKILIVGRKGSEEEILNQLRVNGLIFEYIGLINPQVDDQDPNYLNNISKLNEVVNMYNVDEIVFYHGDITSEKIMDLMTISDNKVTYKIAGSHNQQIIGGESSRSQSKIYNTYSSYNLSKAVYKRLKRVFDFVFGLLFIGLLPILILFSNVYKKRILPDIFNLIIGRKTLIGYGQEKGGTHNLPSIKKPIIKITERIAPKEYSILIEPNLNLWYAKNYSPFIDIEVLKNSFL